MKKFINFILNLFKKMEPQTITTIPVSPAQPSPVVAPLLWDKDNARHSIRVMCDNSGLSTSPTINVDGKMYAPKDIICACIQQESGFDNNVEPRKNLDKTGKVWSTDWGICQINDYWHIIKYHDFKSVDDILQNPQKAVQFMIDCYKDGRIGQWVSYSSGAYKQWL